MSPNTVANKKKYDCDKCGKTFDVENFLKKHIEAKHSDTNENTASLDSDKAKSETDQIFQEDDEFDEAVEDQDLYDRLENFTQKAILDGNISLEEIDSLNSKLKRFKTIMLKKTKLQDCTSTELARVKEENEELSKKIATLTKCDTEQKSK